MPLHFAFSAGHFVDKVGNIGGFAALVGLAVIVLLYFSQARDLKRLREFAAEAPERQAELEQRLMAQLSAVRRTAAAPVQPAPPATGPRPVTPAGAARPAAAPFAPPGVAAPALASATGFPGLMPAAPAPAPEPVAAPAAVPAAAPAVAASVEGGTTTIAPPVPATTNGRSDDATAITPPPPPPPPPPRRSVQIRGQGAAPLRAGGTATATARKQRDPHGRRWAVLMGAGVIVIVALVALLVTGALGGGGGKAKSSSGPSNARTSTPATNAKKKARPKQKPFVRGNTTVSVINGTSTTGLAKVTEDQLKKAGFGAGVASTAADQSHSATVIYYQPGHKRDAQEVKRVLKGGAIEAIGGKNPVATVCAVTANSAPPCGSAVDVVVIVGSDRTQ